jgi:Tol biopolymer transport system component
MSAARVTRRRDWAIALAGVLCAALGPGAEAAHGFYGNGATIASADLVRLEQGDDRTNFAAVSRDGRYVVFETLARNFFADDDPDPPGRYRVGGLFRRDLGGNGPLQIVADGDFLDEDDNALLTRGARNPSVSADGRYVAFSTAQSLVPADTNDNVDIYVRDMNVPIRAAGAFELASARDGGTTPAAYAPRDPPLPGRNPGSEVFGGTSISADGRRVVFRTQEVSDLPARAAVDAPAGQLLVRNLDSHSTTLLTRDKTSGEPAGGAVGAAVISGDGSTVAWSGQNAPPQTTFLNGEQESPTQTYYLWRRLADGPASPTRRVTGIADLDDPACPPGATISTSPFALGPCYGPLTEQEEGRSALFGRPPVMSFDGRRVAFLTAAGPRPNNATGQGLDLYVTDMSPGATRKGSTRELTREGTPNNTAESGQIDGIALSGDGRYIAFTSTRTRFVLGSPAPVGTFRAFADARDLYLIDLAANTLERALRGSNGADANAETANLPTISHDGGRIAFTSLATNLFFGDANERADAFAVTRTSLPPDDPGAGGEPPPAAGGADVTDPLPPVTEAAPFLRVSPRRQRDGRVVLAVNVPGAGTLEATARGRVPATVAGRQRRSVRFVQRTIARARVRARRAGRVTLTLVPPRRYASLLRRRGGLAATARVSFRPVRGRPIVRNLRVVFAASRPARR